MSEPEEAPQPDPRKVRIGLTMVGIVLGASLVIGAVIDEPLVRALMLGIAVLALVRAFMLSRAIRKDLRSPS